MVRRRGQEVADGSSPLQLVDAAPPREAGEDKRSGPHAIDVRPAPRLRP
jgi:hypothetical protein